MSQKSVRRKRQQQARAPLTPRPSVPPPPLPRIVGLAPRYWRDTAPCIGIPDLFGSRCLCFGAALLCLVLAVWVPIMLAIHTPDDFGPLPMVLFLIVIGLLVLSVVLLVRAGLRVGGWFHVDETGLRYGEGPARERGEAAAEIRIGWDEIVARPELAFDVRTQSTGQYFALAPHLLFWRRLPTGELVEHRLILRLSGDIMSCLRYRNHHALLCAVLQGLAARPGLRFMADVFVDAGIDPVTWQPMKRPRRALWLSAGVMCAAVLWFASGVGQDWSPGQLAIGAVAIMLACLVLTIKAWNRAYPELTGLIVFRPED